MELEHDAPLVEPGETSASITDKISATVLQRTPWGWYLGFGLALLMLLVYLAMVGYLLLSGVGIWGINVPVAWGFAITNFVWWLGVGHAGTFISAILLLVRAGWRTSINRFAEGMTIFALITAGLFPILHLGRPWLFYWMVPHPNSMGLWPQFRSPLVWDMVALTTHFVVSLLFWYMGLIPDLATLRDRTRSPRARRIYGLLSLGWIGSAYDWRRYEIAYFLLAALAAPMVISVYSILGLDFAVSIVPGWHTTLAPALFVATTIFSGFAMVILIALPLRAFYSLEEYITARHLDNMGKFLLGTGLVVAFGYLLQFFAGWYSDSIYEEYVVLNRLLGPYAPLYYGALVANILAPQLLWFRRVRRSVPLLFLIAVTVLVGIWLERFLFIIISLHRDYLPSAWRLFTPTLWDWATVVGSVGFFLFLLFLFIRFLPIIAVSEMRELVSEEETGRYGSPGS